jgi:hypothetical protein
VCIVNGAQLVMFVWIPVVILMCIYFAVIDWREDGRRTKARAEEARAEAMRKTERALRSTEFAAISERIGASLLWPVHPEWHAPEYVAPERPREAQEFPK